MDLRMLRVIRPHIVVGGFLGYIAGILYALNNDGSINWNMFIAGYLIVFFMDLSTHFNNDYFDLEADRQAQFKPFGNKNTFIEHPELMKASIYASITSSLISLVLAASLSMKTNWQIVEIVILFNLLGWLYSTPPFRLGSRRLGEISIAVGTGFCVPAVGYIVGVGSLNRFMIFSVPLVLYGFVLSLCLQIPDYEVDKNVGKLTIVGLIGRKNTYILVALCCLGASLISFFSSYGLVPWLSLIPLMSSIFGLRMSDVWRDSANYTRINVFSLFVYILLLNLILLQGTLRIVK